jgi:hypothetical protein
MTTTTVHTQKYTEGEKSPIKLEIATIHFIGKHNTFSNTTITVRDEKDSPIAKFEIYSDADPTITTLPAREVRG